MSSANEYRPSISDKLGEWTLFTRKSVSSGTVTWYEEHVIACCDLLSRVFPVNESKDLVIRAYRWPKAYAVRMHVGEDSLTISYANRELLGLRRGNIQPDGITTWMQTKLKSILREIDSNVFWVTATQDGTRLRPITP